MIAIGQITKCIGIKGELKVRPLTDRMQRFEKLEKVWLGPDDKEGKEYAVEALRLGRDHIVLKLGGVNTRSDADTLKTNYVLVPDDQAERGTGDSFFIHDLIGMNAVTEAGAEIGTIKDVVRLPAGDTWVIRNGEKEILIPGVKEFIRSVDVGRRKVVIHVIEGLVD